MNKTIQVRVDEKTKQAAKEILGDLGLDMSAAIKLYLRQIILRKGLPFLLLTENGLTQAREQEIIDSAKEAAEGKQVSPPMEVKEALDYLRDL